ncbi:hypothetical protein CAG52_10095 [Vibrio sp. V25_P4S6T154]|uniref:hypothetical protein n=1 Tax=Vibrio sp. V20_P4S3T152 TaxID=1938673 RepID=UPI000B9F38DF|nr:hypothetical protein [Vibrio sp. V20_P4S3T152]NAX43830.1 hypothetical protein [Vibrio sp. V25_P4S6T154]OXX63879.1 hypothetical protein B9J89_06385 [Vibrio sp. V15_P4S5T153]
MRVAVFLSPMVSSCVAVLALLVSLWPRIDDVLFDKKADLVIEVLTVENGVAQLLVRNEGNKTGVLSGLGVDFVMTNEKACKSMKVDFDDSRIVKAGEEKIVKTRHNSHLPSLSMFTPLTKVERSKLESLDKAEPTLLNWFEGLHLKSREFTTVCNISISSISSNTNISIGNHSFNCNYVDEEA